MSEKYTISQQDATSIFNQLGPKYPQVSQIAIDANWGPPISGRFDHDFLQIWVATNCSPEFASMELYGRAYGQSAWNVHIPFQYMGPLQNGWWLYGLEYEGTPPQEYVIKVDDGLGNTYYDNNGGYGSNYHLNPYLGRCASAISGADAIYNLSNITNFFLLNK